MVSKGFPNVTTSGRQYNFGEKPSVILYTYINLHAGTPKPQSFLSKSPGLQCLSKPCPSITFPHRQDFFTIGSVTKSSTAKRWYESLVEKFKIFVQDFVTTPLFMVTKSCTKILNFSTRFSCQHFAVEDLATLFISSMRKCYVWAQFRQTCLGSSMRAGEIQNLNCRKDGNGNVFFLDTGEICKRMQSCCSTTVPRTVLKHRHQRMWRFYRRSRTVSG